MDMDMDCNTLVLVGIGVGVFFGILISILIKARQLVLTPMLRGKVFESLEIEDKFTLVKKDSEKQKSLNEALNTLFRQFNMDKNVTLKRSLFKKDDYNYYVCDIELLSEHFTGRNRHRFLAKGQYICLYIDTHLNIPGTLLISKKGNNPLKDNQGKNFKDLYFKKSDNSKVSKEFLFVEVQELFEKYDGRYPMTNMDSNEYPAILSRSVVINETGIALLGNPDGTRINIAEMLDFGKKLVFLIKTITDSEEIK